MRFGSCCSGIEAASVAWHTLGWRAQFVSEIEPFPCAVLAHHYPDVPNFGDMTKFKEWPDADIDVLVGGTPCQSFSVAGLRAGLDDPRGNLMLTFGALAARYRPEWIIWENVPGVLSSNGGRDFGTFLGLLGQLGYGFAYRVLDAQFVRVDGLERAVPQRRRRVFVVGCLGDWRRAAAVLLERQSLSWHSAPRREAREGVAGCAVCGTLRSRHNFNTTEDACGGSLIAVPHADLSPALKARDGKGPSSDGDGDGDGAILVPMVSHALCADGFDASEDGTGRGTPLVPIAFGWQNSAIQGASASAEITPSLDKSKVPAVAMAADLYNLTLTGDVAATLATDGGGTSSGPSVLNGLAVRRLTPTECERLQGFPDGWTGVPYRGKPAADGPRYKALGNSMAVNCMRWIGTRIQMVNALELARAAA